MKLHKVEDRHFGALLESAGHPEAESVEVSKVESGTYFAAETVAEVDSHLFESDLKQHVDVRRKDVGLLGKDRTVTFKKNPVDGSQEARV